MPSAVPPTHVPNGAGNYVADSRYISGGKSPVYAIDFSAVACGARIASTKRKVRWRFGFTNLEAMEAGLTGQECRGEEHEVSLVWSITSGKRVVHVDNQEVHYSNNRGSTFEFSWTMRGSHVLKIVAHASAPLTATQGFRQYNFFVDGLSFYNFPKVYRLNIPGKEIHHAYATTGVPGAESNRRSIRGEREEPAWKLEEPRTEQEEEAILNEVIEESLKEKEKERKKDVEERETEQKQNADTTGDLLDFFAAPAVTTSAQTSTSIVPLQQPTYNQGAPSGTQAWDTATVSSGVQNPYGFAQPSAQVAQPITQQTAAYTVPAPAAAPLTAPAAASYTTPIPYSQPATSTQAAPVPYSYPPATSNSIAPNTSAFDAPTTAPVSNVSSLADKAYMNMANDFSLLTAGAKSNDLRSNPFDAPSSTTAPMPTLESLKANKPESEKKEVMKSNPGSLVVAGSAHQQGNWGGYGTAYTNPSTSSALGHTHANSATMAQSAHTTGMAAQSNSNMAYSAQHTQYNQYQQQPLPQQYPSMQNQYQSQPSYYQQYQPTQP